MGKKRPRAAGGGRRVLISMILKLFVFMARKTSRDNFARKKKLFGVKRIASIFVNDRAKTERIAAAALEYARERNTR